jgi:mono/diheme cytochrome c family protein
MSDGTRPDLHCSPKPFIFVRGAAPALLGLLWLACQTGCSKPPKPEAQVPAQPPIDSRVGEEIFQTRCFVCHGRTGVGDGPSAQGLGAHVRDLTVPDWQNASTDASIAQVIRNGAKAIGGNPAMPPNPDLSDAQIQSLVRYIRQLRKK